MILVFCPNGHVFESRAFTFGGNVRGLTLRGNRETCPFCGSMAEIMDGEFDIVDGVVRLLAAPQMTYDRLHRLRGLVQTLREEDASPEEAAEALEDEAPELARVLLKNRITLAVLQIILTIIGILVGHYDATHQNGGLSNEDVTRIIKEVIDHQQQTPPASSPPQTSTP